jgi:hypothetical protein
MYGGIQLDLGGPQSQSGHGDEEKNSWFLSRIKPQPSSIIQPNPYTNLAISAAINTFYNRKMSESSNSEEMFTYMSHPLRILTMKYIFFVCYKEF